MQAAARNIAGDEQCLSLLPLLTDKKESNNIFKWDRKRTKPFHTCAWISRHEDPEDSETIRSELSVYLVGPGCRVDFVLGARLGSRKNRLVKIGCQFGTTLNIKCSH